MAEALDLVLGDVRRTTDAEPMVTHAGFDDDPEFDTSSALISFGSGQRGVYISNRAPLAERLEQVADIVQDEVTEAIWGAWPVSPDHRNHHLAVRIKDHSHLAVWVCPVAGRTVAEVGKLGLDSPE